MCYIGSHLFPTLFLSFLFALFQFESKKTATRFSTRTICCCQQKEVNKKKIHKKKTQKNFACISELKLRERAHAHYTIFGRYNTLFREGMPCGRTRLAILPTFAYNILCRLCTRLISCSVLNWRFVLVIGLELYRFFVLCYNLIHLFFVSLLFFVKTFWISMALFVSFSIVMHSSLRLLLPLTFIPQDNRWCVLRLLSFYNLHASKQTKIADTFIYTHTETPIHARLHTIPSYIHTYTQTNT